MAKTVTSRMGQTRWSASTDTVARTDFDTNSANIEARTLMYGQGTLSARPAAGTPGRIYTVVGDATPANNGKQYYDNGTSWSTTKNLDGGATAVSTSTSTVPLTIQGFSGQVANLLEVKDSSGTNLALVDATGVGQFKENVLGGTSAAIYTQSASASKTVQVVRGAVSQSANLTEWRDAGGILASVNNTGSAAFVNVSGANANFSGTLNATGATTLGGTGVTGDLAVTSTSANPGLRITKTNGHIYELNGTGGLVARQYLNGTHYSKRLVAGDSGYSAGDTLRVTSQTSTDLGLRVIGAASQSANLLQADNSGGTTVFSVSPAGEVNSPARGIFANGLYTESPSTIFGTAGPALLDVGTGTGTGAYDDVVSFRHKATGAAATRTIALALKFSTEANGTESGKWSGLRAYSTQANSANPGLDLVTNGQSAISINAANTATFFGSQAMSDGNQIGWTNNTTASRIVMFSSGSNLYEMGVQPSGYYMRSAANGGFYFYGGGSHVNANNDPGSGGFKYATMNGGASDPRTYLKRLTIEDAVANDSSTPSFSIGSQSGVHFQMSNGTLNVFTSATNATNAGMSLQTGNGGSLILGNGSTDVRFGSATISLGGKAFTVAYSAPSSPVDGDVWIDVDA